MKFSSTVLITTLLIASKAIGQDPYTPRIADPMLEEWRYAYFPELDGKGVRAIASIPETREYWFGLDSGVASYDGYNWTFYHASEGLGEGAVQCIMADRSQNIYATTAFGLFKLKNGENKWETVFSTKGGSGILFRTLNELESGTIVCGSDAGAFFTKNGKTTCLSTQDRWNNYADQLPEINLVELTNDIFLKNNFTDFTDVFEVRAGQLWVAITYEESEEEKGEIITIGEEEILNAKISNSGRLSKLYNFKLGYDQQIFRTSNGHIWITNRSNKIPSLRYRRSRWETVYQGQQFGDDEYTENILETDDKKIWVSGVGNIYCLDTQGKWTKYSSLSLNVPQGHMILHSAGHSELWVIGVQSSVYRVDLSDEKWLTLKGLNFQCQQSDSSNWFLDVEGQIVVERNHEWTKLRPSDKSIDSPVALFCDSRDIIWAIGSHKGISSTAFLIGKQWTRLTFDSLSWGIDYRAIIEDTDGSIWLGSSTDRYGNLGQTGGLVQILNPYESDQRKIVRHKPGSNGLNHSNAYGLAQSSDGRIWVGGSGLCQFDQGTWKYEDDPDLNDFVNDLHVDQRGILYVGSRQHGLYILNGNKWKNYSLQNGLLSNNTISLATGSDGEIWLASDKGFSFFNGQDWSNNIFPKELTFSYEGGSLNLTSENHLWISRSLREWKRRAYTGNSPNQTIRDQFLTYRFIKGDEPPETEIIAYAATVDQSGNTTIVWSGKHYFNQTKTSELFYSYRLNDGEWSTFDRKDNHTFTGLTDDNYTFEVRAMDHEGNIDASPASVKFEVLPPVWKQPWFIVLIASFLITVSVFQYQIIKKRAILDRLNKSLQKANGELESRNQEIQTQRDSLEVAVKKIDELSQAKVKFFTNITHEFRTPLSLILGPIEKLTKEAPADSTLRYFYNLIFKNTLRLQKLINQLLEIRRIESGTLELVLNETDIVSFVSDVKNLFTNQATDRSIRLSFHSDFDKLTMLFDPDKIEKILFNLLSNAFKHTPNGGKISVKLLDSEKYLRKDNDLEFVRLMVSDNGTGMEDKVMDKLFERFTVGHNDLDDHLGENSGIGLSYIKDLIEAHKGNIKVESELGKGTTFTVYIPSNLELPQDYIEPSSATQYDPKYSIDASILTSESQRLGNGAAAKPDESHPTLLVVEDNPDMRSFITNLLKSDYNVLNAENGKAGLEVLDKSYVDLIISDIMMPEVDGLSFCQQVKTNPTTSHIPVILLTALTMEDKRISGYDSGADSYIVKPFKPELIQSRIDNLLQSREVLKTKYAEDLRFKPKNIKVTSFDEEFLDKLSSMMEEHVSDSQFDVRKMCDMASMSHMHFIRKVKQLTGKKPIDLLKSFRLARAKQLLEQNKINVSEVGYMVGYNVPNSFTRAFRTEYGVSPTQFIQNLEKEGVK